MKKFILRTTLATTLAFSSLHAETATFDNLSAKETIAQAHLEFAEGRVSSLWNALPASYQKDVTEVVHLFGTKVDPKVYNESFQTFVAATSLLDNKKDIILELIQQHAPPHAKKELENFTANYDLMVDFMQVLSTSEIKSSENLKKLNVLTYLQSLDPIMEKMNKEAVQKEQKDRPTVEQIKKVKIEQVEKKGNSINFKLSYENGQTEKIQMTKVEGKWVPSNIAAHWDEGIKEVKKSLNEMDNMKAQDKDMAIKVLHSVQELAGSLEKTKNMAEFMQTAQQGGQAIFGLMMQQQMNNQKM